jgi:hypothetical protein
MYCRTSLESSTQIHVQCYYVCCVSSNEIVALDEPVAGTLLADKMGHSTFARDWSNCDNAFHGIGSRKIRNGVLPFLMA